MDFDLFIPDEYRGVWNVLLCHQGRANSIGQEALAAAVGLPPRKVREIVHDLVVVCRRAICSTYGGKGQAGYYLPANEKEAYAAAVALKKHAIKILRRASVLEGIGLDLTIGSLYREAGDAAR